MKIQVTVSETHKIQDGTIKGTIIFPAGTLRRDSVEFEDAAAVTLSTGIEAQQSAENADPVRDMFIRHCLEAFDRSRIDTLNMIKEAQEKEKTI